MSRFAVATSAAVHDALCSLLALDPARNAPRHVDLLSPFFFASPLGLIISDQFRRLLEDWPVLYVVAWYSAKPDIERPNDHGHGSTHQSHRATAMSQVTVAERILTQHPRPPVLLTAANGPLPVLGTIASNFHKA